MAHSRSVEKQAVLSALTLNIARFTRWPEPVFKDTGPVLNLCIVGDHIIQTSFLAIENKVINNKTIRVLNVSRLRNLKQCQILYISELERNRLIRLLKELKDLPILTIGENFAFIKAGGMVGLLFVEGKISLNINLAVVKASGLVVSSRLLKLAKIFEFPFLNPKEQE